MKYKVYFLYFALLLLLGIPTEGDEMEADTLIQLLNYSKTLIQNGELKYIYYAQEFIRSTDVGVNHRKKISNLERQLRENPPKSEDPEALRKEILQELENEKKYGAFRDSNEFYNFVEVNLVYQPGYAYRMEVVSRFENYPSLASHRYYGGAGYFYRFSNSTKFLKGLFPNYLPTSKHGGVVGSIEIGELEKPEDAFTFTVSYATNNLPPMTWSLPTPSEDNRTQVHLTEGSDGIPIYVIVSYDQTPNETYPSKKKTYVQLVDGLPQIIREDLCYKSNSSPHADADGYCISAIKLHSEYNRIETLNIAVPQVIEERSFLFWEPDNFMDRRTFVIIQEMDFNLDLPPNFFDWKETERSGIRLTSLIGKKLNVVEKEQQMAQPEMIKIEGGTVQPFSIGETVTVSTFYIDKHLVTYQQYNQFIEDGGYKKKKYWSKEGRKFLEKYEFWAPSTYHEEYLNRKNLPVTGVSWYEAEAYANWRGMRLPTAAEWTLACQGDTKQRFPWGNEFDFEAVDYRARLAPYAVGSREKNASPVGVYDLVGNVWQWCADAYEGKDFRLEAEPTGTKPGPLKILRGGGWMSLRRHFESDYLYYDKPFHRLATYGFRCAEDVEAEKQ